MCEDNLELEEVRQTSRRLSAYAIEQPYVLISLRPEPNETHFLSSVSSRA